MLLFDEVNINLNERALWRHLNIDVSVLWIFHQNIYVEYLFIKQKTKDELNIATLNSQIILKF